MYKAFLIFISSVLFVNITFQMFNMNSLVRGISTLLLSCIALGTQAQNIAEDEGILSAKEYARYLGIGAGAAYHSLHDELMSAMRYERIGATANISNTKISETKYTELSFQGAWLKMGRKSEELINANMRSLKATMDYRHMYKLSLMDEAVFDVRAGVLFSTLFAYRNAPHLINASDVYEYAISLGLTGKIAKQQSFGSRQGHIIWDMSIPFISDISRPGYLNQSTELDPDATTLKTIFANNTFTSFGKMFRLNSRIHLLYPLKNGNKLRFTYQWDYYKMKSNSGAKVFSAEHSLILNFLFNY